MISERKFSNSFSSFWNELLPTAESYIRRLNLSCDRYCLPTESLLDINRDRRAVINEFSFRLFKAFAEGIELSPNDKMKLSKQVSTYIENLVHNIRIQHPISKVELNESEILSKSLIAYFQDRELTNLQFWPVFKGCGMIQACKGDIISNHKLIEVKAGDRHFRITDIRQIITYLSLNSISKQYIIKSIALVNPRKGLSYETTVDILIQNCSRRKPVDVFGDIIDFVSTEVISK